MKIVLIDQNFHEKEVNFKFLPEMGSILHIELDKKTHRIGKFKIISGGNRNYKNKIVPTLYVESIKDAD